MKSPLAALTRRRFLTGLGGGLALGFLAACGMQRSAMPTPSASGTAGPTDTPTPGPSATPGPSLRDRIGQLLLVGFRGVTDPFRNLVRDGLADAVLTAHVFNSKLDPEHPATLSQPIITRILRDEIGWDGVVISDDMQMGAIRQAYGYSDALRLAILAGVDVLTIAQQQVYEPGIGESTIDLIEGLVTDGSLSEARIDESYRRIRALKSR